MNVVSINIVKDGGYAESIGLRPKDVIYRIDGNPVSGPQHVTDAIANGPVTFSIVRDNYMFDVQIESSTLGVVLGDSDFSEERFLRAQALNKITVSTTCSIPTKTISKTIGVVHAQCVDGVNIFADVAVGITDVFGGRSKPIQQAIATATEQVICELRNEAYKVGANGIIGATFRHADIGDKGGFILMVTASGTAVVVEE